MAAHIAADIDTAGYMEVVVLQQDVVDTAS